MADDGRSADLDDAPRRDRRRAGRRGRLGHRMRRHPRRYPTEPGRPPCRARPGGPPDLPLPAVSPQPDSPANARQSAGGPAGCDLRTIRNSSIGWPASSVNRQIPDERTSGCPSSSTDPANTNPARVSTACEGSRGIAPFRHEGVKQVRHESFPSRDRTRRSVRGGGERPLDWVPLVGHLSLTRWGRLALTQPLGRTSPCSCRWPAGRPFPG